MKGYKIEFNSSPVSRRMYIPSIPFFSQFEIDILDLEIAKLLAKQVIEDVDSNIEAERFFSNIFLRPQKDGTYRIILEWIQ